jgi:hypothetical protein
MMEYGYEQQLDDFIRKIRSETAARLNIMMSSHDLIKAVKEHNMYISRDSVYQQDWHKFYPLVAYDKWEVVYSEWADTYYHYNEKPVFIEVDLYKEWDADKEGFFKNNPNKRWHDDSSSTNGMGDIICGGHYLRLREETKYVTKDYLNTDCIAIKIYDEGRSYNCDTCDSSSGSYHFTERKLRATFILRPKLKTKKEREELIIEMFRSNIADRLAEIKLNKFMNKLVPKLAADIINE